MAHFKGSTLHVKKYHNAILRTNKALQLACLVTPLHDPLTHRLKATAFYGTVHGSLDTTTFRLSSFTLHAPGITCVNTLHKFQLHLI